MRLDPERRDDSFLWRQLRAAGLGAVAEKVAAGRDLELDEALALSRASLPLLGKMVQLRPAASDAGDTAAAGALPIERVASLPKFAAAHRAGPGRLGVVLPDTHRHPRRSLAERGDDFLVSDRGSTLGSGPRLRWRFHRRGGLAGDRPGPAGPAGGGRGAGPAGHAWPQAGPGGLGFRRLAPGLRGPGRPDAQRPAGGRSERARRTSGSCLPTSPEGAATITS